jgi:hypothetical protein
MYIFIIMVVKTESTKCQPVDIKSDLFKTVHQWAYLNQKWLLDIFSITIVPKQTLSLDVKYIPKLRTYTLFKTEFETEKYVSLRMKRNERPLLTQLKCGILPLHVETGRYIGERSVDFVLIEEHSVVKCPFYRHIRSENFGELYNTNDFNSKTDSEKIVYLINNKSRTLAKYIVKSYLYRRQRRDRVVNASD